MKGYVRPSVAYSIEESKRRSSAVIAAGATDDTEIHEKLAG